MDRNETLQKISEEFEARLKGYLGEAGWERGVFLTQTQWSDNCCHFGDLCDANVFMGEAFEQIVGRESDAASQEDADLWNDSWDLFKARVRRYPDPREAGTIRGIAKAMGIETLESRGQDRLDFHELSVWQIETALIAAYRAGKEDK